MTKPLTAGEKALRANIRKQKAIGAKAAKARAAKKVENYLAHVERNNQAAIQAAYARQMRIALHERQNRLLAEAAKWDREARKAEAARQAAGIPSVGDLVALHGAEGAAEAMLAGAQLPKAA